MLSTENLFAKRYIHMKTNLEDHAFKLKLKILQHNAITINFKIEEMKSFLYGSALWEVYVDLPKDPPMFPNVLNEILVNI